MLYLRQSFYSTVWLGRNRDPDGKLAGGLPDTYGIPVLYVALDPQFNPQARQHNLAMVVTTHPMQFNSFTYAICLPDENNKDDNAGTNFSFHD